MGTAIHMRLHSPVPPALTTLQAFPRVQLHSATQPVCALCSRPVRNTHKSCSRISAPSRAFAAIARTYPGRLLLHPGWCAGATSQCERVRGLRVSFSVLALRARDDSDRGVAPLWPLVRLRRQDGRLARARRPFPATASQSQRHRDAATGGTVLITRRASLEPLPASCRLSILRSSARHLTVGSRFSPH